VRPRHGPSGPRPALRDRRDEVAYRTGLDAAVHRHARRPDRHDPLVYRERGVVAAAEGRRRGPLRRARPVTRWLVTGAGGQLGSDLVAALHGEDVRAVARADLDIADSMSVARLVDEFAPDVVVNAAAYTAVDAA